MIQTDMGTDAHILSFPDFCKKYKVNAEDETVLNVYNALHDGKSGFVSITQTKGNKVGFTYSGHTTAFNVGITLFLETDYDYYYTSVIQSINWEEGYFDTLNSRYEFTFKEDVIPMLVEVINKSNNELPEYASAYAAGMDLRASLSEDVVLHPMERKIIPTDLYMAIPEGYELQIRPRSGLAIKKGITCINTPGTIDSDYRGNVGVILINLSTEDFTISNGDRIAQAVLNKVERVMWQSVDELSSTERGDGGFGHSGVK